MRSTRPLVWWVLMWLVVGGTALMIPDRMFPVGIQYVGLPVVVGLILRKRLQAPMQMDAEEDGVVR